TGEGLFMQTCSACHGQGIAGALKAGDKAAWGPRIAKGKDTLYQHALNGFQGTAGVMPPKGGRTDAPDALVKEAVDYMVGLAKYPSVTGHAGPLPTVPLATLRWAT